MNTQMALLPWSGMPNVTCTLNRKEDGTVTGRLVIHLPQGGEPIVLQATANEREIEAFLKARYAKELAQHAKNGNAVAGWKLFKNIARMAKKIVRSKVVTKLAGGFKKIMDTPILGPALGTMFPATALTYAALKGADALGITKAQAHKIRHLKNPRVRQAVANKLRARAKVLNRIRWARAQRQASGRTPLLRRPNAAEAQALAALRARGVIAGDAAVADAAVAGLARNMTRYGRALLARARAGQPRARRLIAVLNAKAKAGNPDAIRGRRVLAEIAKELRVPYVAGYEPGSHGAGDVLSIAGNRPYLAVGAAPEELSGAMSLHNYYNIIGADPNDMDMVREMLGQEAQPVAAGWGPYPDSHTSFVSAGDALDQQYGGSYPVVSIQGEHTHQVQLPNFQCTPMANPVQTGPAAAAGQLVIGSDGKQYQKTWNGWRWIWQEMRPHLGIRGETQGFGTRDALLLGMRTVQQRELRS